MEGNRHKNYHEGWNVGFFLDLPLAQLWAPLIWIIYKVNWYNHHNITMLYYALFLITEKLTSYKIEMLPVLF